MPEIANFSTKYFIFSKVFTDEGGIKQYKASQIVSSYRRTHHATTITCHLSFQWIPNRPSLAAGLIVSGFGGGSLIFNQVITAYINPDNLKPDLVTEDGERYAHSTVEALQCLEHRKLVYHGCFELVLESLGKTADLG